MVSHDHDIEIELLQKDKCQLDMRAADLTQERSNLEAKLEKRQNVILRLQSQLSTLQCELDELKAEYEKLADDSIKRISDLTDKQEKEVQCLRDNFAKEKEDILIASETLKIDAEAMVHEIKETNSFLTEELKDVQRLYKDVRIVYLFARTDFFNCKRFFIKSFFRFRCLSVCTRLSKNWSSRMTSMLLWWRNIKKT